MQNTRTMEGSCPKLSCKQRRNLAIKIGVGVGNRPWVLGILFYEGVKLERG
jgi:hypothetical protein